MILASLASADVPRRLASDLEVVSHPREAGIATWHDPRQPCVFQVIYALPGERRTVDV